MVTINRNGSQSKLCYFPQNCWTEVKIATLYLNARERCLHRRDKGSFEIANHSLQLKDNP
ncbi:hypothetical protein T05_14869 [Trichinella murrelli]|uniref:Uncharacterized protein n=1 Tax=Trichinella murrelli TaxID=144512 RepID=A0A0V0UEX7_9BILA|nr:hypothetical protein T05_14869 [Trichinella murrelli]